MGCVSSVFQFGSYLVHEGAETAGDSKEDRTAGNKDEVPFSPSHQEITTVDDNKEESALLNRFGAPLAQEEDYLHQNKDSTPEKINKENNEECVEKEKIVKSQDYDVRELQRIHESKVEKEKTVDNSGCTTEKTVYSQFTESMKVQESKGPAVDPFASSSQTIFPSFQKSWENKLSFPESQTSAYVHNVTVEENQNLPSKSASDDLSTLLGESKPSKFIESESELWKEPVDISAEKLRKHSEMQSKEITCDAEISNEEKSIDELLDEENGYEREDVADAIVKIQAGVRGYLTRKTLKENRKNDNFDDNLQQKDVPENLLFKDDYGCVENVTEVLTGEVDESSSEIVGEHDAAVRIQAMYRGYKTRKHLDGVRNVSPNPEFESSEILEEINNLTRAEAGRVSPKRSPATVTENFIPTLSQKIVTPPSSPKAEKYKDDMSFGKSNAEEGIAKESIESCLDSEHNVNLMEVHTSPDDEFILEDEGENQAQAATKIQAAFRGYKVRKVKKSDIKNPETTMMCSESNNAIESDLTLVLQDTNIMEINTKVSGIIDATPKNIVNDFDGSQENGSETRVYEQFLSGVEYSFTNTENDDEGITEDLQREGAEAEGIQWQSSDIYIKGANFPSLETGEDKGIVTVRQELDPDSPDTSDLDHSEKYQKPLDVEKV